MLQRGTAGCSAVVAGLILLGLAGCGGGVKTYPVRGQVVLADGDVKQLAGSHVEFMLASDPTARADGLIGPDGHFDMQTLHEGKVLKGVLAGTYQARLILSGEDDGGAPQRRGKPIHDRFLDFKTSGLSYTVPTSGDITVAVSRK
jgi:hypothetical protein